MSPRQGPERPADRIRKLVTLAASGDTPEALLAREKAREAIGKLNVELLDTLAGQRRRLLKQLWDECRRLYRSNERATKGETGDLVNSAALLLGHYERYDALIAAVLLARIEAGHTLTSKERQQLDGPLDSWLDGFMSRRYEDRRQAREARRQERRARDV
jgi:hypothetical protein